MALNDVSNILWRERQLLELLVFKLEEEQLLLSAGRTRWLPHATREVEAVLRELRAMELDRAVTLEGVLPELGLASGASLRELVEAAPPPWNKIFDEHRTALLDVAQEIDALAKGNRDLLLRGQEAARAALDALGEAPRPGGDVELRAYTPQGAVAVGPRPTVRLIDEAV